MCGKVGVMSLDEGKELTLSYHRMKTDTDKSFEAFRIYRDMGTSRSLVQVAKQLGKSNTLLCRWSSKHNWIERVALWDGDVDRRMTRQELFDREAAAMRHMRISRRMQELADGQIKKHRQMAKEVTGYTIEADKAARIAKEAIQIERLVLGDPTERTETTQQLDWSKLSTEEILQFKALAKKLKGDE
jgi:mannose/fructose/N-acetylgalactosamine-specific phosphotransferase system component IIB